MKNESKVLRLARNTDRGNMRRGYTSLGEHDPFITAKAFVDGDMDDYTGKDENFDRLPQQQRRR